MNTLLDEPLASVLRRLSVDAEATMVDARQTIGRMAPGQFAEAIASKTGWREFYALAKDFHLAISPETGRLLYLLARSTRATQIVEFGTSFGVSTLYLAAAVRDNGGGRVIGSEFESSKAAVARQTMIDACVDDIVEIREGDALETLSRQLPESIDLVLLDGAKALYAQVLAQLEPRMPKGALVIADNVEMSPDYLAVIRSSERSWLSLPFGEDVEVSMKC
ncbi:O-methyltransferase [soil metagenome]